MAVYKVPQDVEADDKFLGPLSFKQFLFAGGALISGYITYLLANSTAWVLASIFVLPLIIFGFLAFPWSKDQPTELWLASRIRFLIMPRRKIWDQSGIKELVKVTVPKKVVNALTDGLSGNEVRNRMGALASMIDSRGWVVKQNRYTDLENNDRLIDPIAPEVSDKSTILSSTIDMMDEGNGTLARQFDNLLQKSETSQNIKTKQLIETARHPDNHPQQTQNNIDTKQENFWFLNQNGPAINAPGLATFKNAPIVSPGATNSAPSNTAIPQSTISTQESAVNPVLDEAELLKKVHDKQIQDRLQTRSTYEKIIPPLNRTPVKAEVGIQPKNPVTPPKDPGIISLSRSNDLNIETLQRQGDKKDLSDNEVIISLH